MPDTGRWLRPALAVVGAVTLLRIAALAFDRTDLFVDESQYWLWGQRLDFGYYSKPPLIAWLIRGVTELAGSETPFWVRMPGSVLHGATALILGALAARLFSARAAIWVAVAYVTVPFASLGSLLMSTDTVMAPFFAAALYFWFRAVDEGHAGTALAAGVACGLGFLAKYAAVYFLLGAGLAAVAVPQMRAPVRLWLMLLAGFAATVSPNVIWNLTHDLTTVEHTMDNVGWVRDSGGTSINPAGLAEFFLSQFAVFGPVLFGVLVWLWMRPGTPRLRALTAFSAPVLLLVCGQALLSRAYANWAVATYFAGSLIAVPWLLDRFPRLLRASFVANGLIALALPALTVLAPWPAPGGKPLLARYLGRADLSHEIIALAQKSGVGVVMAAEREVLADLFYTGSGSGLVFRAPAPDGRPRSYYEQNFAVSSADRPVLAVLRQPPICKGFEQLPVTELHPAGAYAGRSYGAYLIGGDCAAKLR